MRTAPYRSRLRRRMVIHMRITITASLLAALVAAACTTEPPAWLTTCEQLEPLPASEERAQACKEACGGDQLCSGASQPACELECGACAPDVAWCPTDGWAP